MRPFETMLLLVLMLVLMWRLFEGARGTVPGARRPVATLLLGMVALHLVVEGPRWQFIPAYAILVLLIVRGFLAKPGPTLSMGIRALRASVFAMALLVVAVNLVLGYALPIPRLPQPDGPYAIGTALFALTQPERPDPYGRADGETRRFPVQVWYPAANTENARRMPWNAHSDAFARAAVRRLSLPFARVFFSHLDYAMSHSYEDAPPLNDGGPYPVVIYSHGWTGWRTVAINEVERLASEGFVVFAPDHTYGAMASVFPDGEAVPNYPPAMPPKDPVEAWQQGIELLVDTYAGDLNHLLDVLPRVNAGDIKTPVAGLLDLERIGLYGHSTGGGAVTEVATLDPRVDAALALDPWVEPVSKDVVATSLDVPYMSIRSEEWATRDGDNNAKLARILEKAEEPVWDLYLAGTEHRDFTVAPLLFPWGYYFGLSDSKAGRRELQVTDDYIEAFFARYLKGEDLHWFDTASSAYPEMVYVSVTSGPDAGK